MATTLRLTTYPFGQRHGPRRRDASASRGGFTLVEMMVAVMILAVGLLGLVSTSAVVTRQVSGGAMQSTAANVVQSRLEWFRSVSCDQIADGSALTNGVRERWTRGQMVNRVLWIRAQFDYSVGGTPRSQVYTMTVPCPR